MTLQEIEFELPAAQHALMDYAGLRQGQPLTLILDAGVLLPDPAAPAWYAVQKEALPGQVVRTGPATYAFSGQIVAADIGKGEPDDLSEPNGDGQSAVLLVQCGDLPVRVTCAPQADGVLPWGTWETRYLAGYGLLSGIVEDDFASGIGESVGVTVWHVNRLMLTPGDPNFGRWVESDTLLNMPYSYDRIVVAARVHRRTI